MENLREKKENNRNTKKVCFILPQKKRLHQLHTHPQMSIGVSHGNRHISDLLAAIMNFGPIDFVLGAFNRCFY